MIPRDGGDYMLVSRVIHPVVGVMVLATGWSWARRILNTMFWIVTGGLIVAVVIALFTSQGSFISDFNGLGRTYTGHGGAYQTVLHAATATGVALHPALSLGNTIPIIGIFAGFSI